MKKLETRIEEEADINIKPDGSIGLFITTLKSTIVFFLNLQLFVSFFC